MCCHLLALSTSHGNAERICRERYGDNAITAEVVKAISGPANTGDDAWAAVWTLSDSLNDLVTATPSALALLRRKSKFSSVNLLERWSIPGVVTVPASTWIAEGQPIPVVTGTIGPRLYLGPKRLSTIVSATREQLQGQYVEYLLRSVLTESLTLAFDSVLLGSTAATTVRPPGLLFGIDPLTPSDNPDPAAAMLEDLGALVAALDANTEAASVTFVMNKSQALVLRLAYPNINGSIIASPQVPVGRVIAVDASALAVGIGSPQFDLSRAGVLVENDIPAELVNGSGAVGVSQRSLWQSASVGLRVMLDVNWGMRGSNRVAWMEGVTW